LIVEAREISKTEKQITCLLERRQTYACWGYGGLWSFAYWAL